MANKHDEGSKSFKLFANEHSQELFAETVVPLFSPAFDNVPPEVIESFRILFTLGAVMGMHYTGKYPDKAKQIVATAEENEHMKQVFKPHTIIAGQYFKTLV